MSQRKKLPWLKTIFNQYELNEKSKHESTTPVKRKRSHLTRSADVKLNDEIAATTIESSNNKWIEKYEPSCSAELAVHSKKLDEVQNWFSHCETMLNKKEPVQICLLTGPTGSGKTTTVRVLAKEHGYQLLEWINPIDQDFMTTLGDQQSNHGLFVQSQKTSFKNFLLTATRYKSLSNIYQKQMILVEDFPNAVISDVDSFAELLQQVVERGRAPLVFIIADTKARGSNIHCNLFTEELRDKLRIMHINFNAVADTIMHKALKGVSALMSKNYSDIYKPPDPTLIENIIMSANGDIRNAFINLHFACLKCNVKMDTEEMHLTENRRNKIKKKIKYKLKSVGRNENITMFHALGRVFNPKYNNDQRLIHNPESVADCFSTEPKRFTDFIFENYLGHYTKIEDVNQAIIGLCFADLLYKEYRDDVLSLLALNISVRSVMVANTYPKKGLFQVRGPKHINISLQMENKEKKLIQLGPEISANLYATDFSAYIKIIAKN